MRQLENKQAGADAEVKITGDSGFEVTSVMIEAGINALADFGPREDFEATDQALIVCEVYCVMRHAERLTHKPTA